MSRNIYIHVCTTGNSQWIGDNNGVVDIYQNNSSCTKCDYYDKFPFVTDYCIINGITI